MSFCAIGGNFVNPFNFNSLVTFVPFVVKNGN